MHGNVISLISRFGLVYGAHIDVSDDLNLVYRNPGGTSVNHVVGKEAVEYLFVALRHRCKRIFQLLCDLLDCSLVYVRNLRRSLCVLGRGIGSHQGKQGCHCEQLQPTPFHVFHQATPLLLFEFLDYAAPTSWIKNVDSGSASVAWLMNSCAASSVYSPGKATRFATWFNPCATFTTKYCFIGVPYGRGRLITSRPLLVLPLALCTSDHLLLVFYVYVLGIDHAFVFLLACAAGGPIG